MTRDADGDRYRHHSLGFLAGAVIGTLRGLIGLGGAEFRLPVLVGAFRVPTLEAVTLNLDIKLAGSLSLAISLPTMLVGFARYSSATAFSVLREERRLLLWMAAGSVVDVGLGGLLLGTVPAKSLTALLGVILLISAVKTFQHAD